MLPLPRFSYENLLDASATTITASTSATGFPVSYVADDLRALRWRATGRSAEFIKVDLGSVTTFNSLIVWDGNFSTAATITIQISNDDVTYRTEATPVPTTEGQVVVQGAEFSARYIKFVFTDTSIADLYIEVGRVFVGSYLEAEVHQDLGWEHKKVSYTVRSRTPGGVIHSLIRPIADKQVMPFSLVPPSMKAAFEEMIDAADSWMPMWVTFTTDNATAEQTLYVLLDPELCSFRLDDCDLYSFMLTYEEVI